MYIKKQEEYLKNVITSCGYQINHVVLIPASKKEFGDYQYNGIMALAKEQKENPRELASKIVNKLNEEQVFEKVEVAGPGFINITFKKENVISDATERITTKKYIEQLPKKKVIIDYGGPNVAKILHVGHLRSANIGESLKRLAKSLGYEVIGDIHLGDYGLQMGMIMLEIENRYPNLSCFQEGFKSELVEDLPITNEDLIDLYPIASKKAKENIEIMEKARQITFHLQNNHSGYKALWRTIMKISLKDMKEIYEQLNVKFDLWLGESDAEKFIPEMLEYLKEKNMIQESEGAEVIEVSEEEDKLEIPPLLLVKSNKTVSYETTDMATLWDRIKTYNPDEIWYVADKRQELHFTQVFRASYKSEIVPLTTKLEFIGFGTMNGVDGRPFKTRDGGVMSLRELLHLVEKETEKNMIPTISGKEREESTQTISIGTIKFADLLSHRATDYIFDLEKFSDANGKTGPFILYSTIRMKSLLKKAKENGFENNIITTLKDGSDYKVLLQSLNLQKVLENALKEKSLHELTNYLYTLNNTYNNFYTENRILTEENIELKKSWIALTQMIYDINNTLLDILAIKLPTRM